MRMVRVPIRGGALRPVGEDDQRQVRARASCSARLPLGYVGANADSCERGHPRAFVDSNPDSEPEGGRGARGVKREGIAAFDEVQSQPLSPTAQGPGDAQLGEMMVMDYRVAELDARQRAMLDFAWKLTLAPHDIGDDDRGELREAGFTDQDIFDICDTAAFFNYTNRVAHGIGMMPNPEYHAMNR